MRVSALVPGLALLVTSRVVDATSHITSSHHDILLRRATYDTVCPEGQYRYTNKCFPCQDPNALKCRMRGTIALECKTGTSLKNGVCLVECGRRYRHDESTGLCVRCADANAVTCTATEALSCSDKFLLNGVCVTQTACPAGTFPDTRTRTCRACSNVDADAASCTRSLATSCSTLYLLDGKCVSECGKGFYQDDVAHKCSPCADPRATTCNKDGTLICSTGSLSGSVCVDECGEKAVSQDGVCVACQDPAALTCSDPKTSTSCGLNEAGDKTYLDTDAATCVLPRDCPVGHFSQESDKICAPCKSGASTCDSDGETTACSKPLLFNAGECVESCPDGTRVVEGSCLSCGEGIATCDADGNALTCGADLDGRQRFLSPDSTCVAECPSRTFVSSDAPVCSPCGDGALTCSSPEVALTCGTNESGASTFLASDNTCVTSCQDGLFADAKTSSCKPCADGAATCSNDGVTTSCIDGLYLTPSFTCVERAQCPAGTFPSGAAQQKRLRRRASSVTKAACIQCAANAISCFSTTQASACGEDANGKQTFLLNGRCIAPSICPDWSFADTVSHTCKRCSAIAPGSETCDSKGALSCGVVDQHQLYVTPNQNCVLPAECPSNTFVDTDNFACTTCDDGVVTCEGVGPGNALTCGRTSKGVSLFFDATDKACVTADACPVSTWADEATSTCVQCDDGETSCSGNGSGDAISCGKNKKGESTYLHPSKDCVIADQCPVAFFADEASSTCVQCDEGEASCVSAGPGGATSCAKNAAGDQLFLDPSGECVTAKDCPVATFADKTDNTCSACGDGALICTSKTDASLCGTNRAGHPSYLDDGLCVEATACSKGSWPDVELFVCRECSIIDKDAATCSPSAALSCKKKLLWDGSCVSDCPSTTFIDTSARTCTNCASIAPHSATCSKTQALTCNPGWWLLDGACVATCPDDQFGDYMTGTCKKCTTYDPHARRCNSAGIIVCDLGFRAEGRECTAAQVYARWQDASFGTVTANDKWIYWTAFSVLCEIDCGNQGYQFYSHNTIEDKCMCYNKSPIRGNRALIPSQGTLSGGPGTCEELAKFTGGMSKCVNSYGTYGGQFPCTNADVGGSCWNGT